MATARTARGLQDILSQTIGIAHARAERHVCARSPLVFEGAAQLTRMVAGQRSGGNDKTPPNSPVVEPSAAAN
ncbi:MAG TPA: hypothetical protein VGP28_02470 [Methylocella sp.]|jgi:hypothetical protein|nr:hypothetical protein [Methylocella sp.]